MNAWNLVGVLFIIVGVIGGLGFLGEVNPISFISDPLFNLVSGFLTDFASLIFFGILVFLGLSLATPRGGYARTIISRR